MAQPAGEGVRVAVDTKNYDKARYQTIYPQYIDASLGPSEGRRLTKKQSVETPTMEEMVVGLHELGYRDFFVERAKSLPAMQGTDRYPLVPRGRVKVAIKEPLDKHYIKKSEFDTQTRGAVVAGIESKQELLRRLATAIKAKGTARPEVPSVATILASVPGVNQPKTKGK
ncbi:signal recognition particle subunit SRP19 [Strigomonas culicis]|uniref:Signal recognition particle subunit SRP19 n=1 Tax=Strigomonas culicis TaxID=28005 RepID=S9US70_9TRYP|nr:signal recognition particle subunit SRP19 [Strigomonas culicis]EPY33802.1 signal recognition particle subunit SRP19 [Strigomonas culicis]|eukprot:EPY26174.1 signal recognition particle subunit SRP19 [Strigomonas culicis]